MRHTHNKTYFDNPTTPEQYYDMGFMFADGGVLTVTDSILRGLKSRCNRLRIDINRQDEEILVGFKSRISATQPIRRYTRFNKKRKVTTYSSEIAIHGIGLVSGLIKHGCGPNKSLTVTFPEIPEKYLCDFILGFMDGDGGICCQIGKKGQVIGADLHFRGTFPFLKKLNEILSQKCGEQGHFYFLYKSVPSLVFCKKANVVKLGDYLYTHCAHIALARKYTKYLKLKKEMETLDYQPQT